MLLSLTAFAALVPAAIKAAGSGNPYDGATVVVNPEYVNKVKAAVGNISDSSLAAQAAMLEKIPTFFWIDAVARVDAFGQFLSQVDAAGGTPLVQAVIYDVPDRDCSANASAGELVIADGGAEKYQAFIDSIAEQVEKFPNVRIVMNVEPDSLPNLVTNLKVPKCANAETTYKKLVSYAISKLQQDNVWLYLDGAHCGWLGWPDHLQPAADLFASVLRGAGGNATVRGIATDTSNYNLLRGEKDPAQTTNPNYNEELYIEALAPLLQAQGFPSQFIVDQGRSGVAGIRNTTSEWCNINGAGLGPRPSTDTGNELIDSTVCIKPPGESDGTSDPTAPRFDARCARNTSAKSAPQAGEWFQSYFEMLVRNANPPLA